MGAGKGLAGLYWLGFHRPEASCRHWCCYMQCLCCGAFNLAQSFELSLACPASSVQQGWLLPVSWLVGEHGSQIWITVQEGSVRKYFVLVDICSSAKVRLRCTGSKFWPHRSRWECRDASSNWMRCSSCLRPLLGQKSVIDRHGAHEARAGLGGSGRIRLQMRRTWGVRLPIWEARTVLEWKQVGSGGG